MSTDRIELRGLRVFAHHGVFDFEKRDGQEFVVDLTVWTDFSAAAKSDDLAETIHYGELADLVVGIVGGAPRDLVETVVSEVADRVMAWDPRIAAVEVVLHKPSAPIPHTFEDVWVVTSRRREAEE
ncbi:dihydroneopterin aldolase [Nocardia crassostreae]|uniref:dihydroneopterin aldolase n=1 Tax=Nocardia crassostreae TaxID=53428 RepID=UPI00082E9F6B|nr:dihydroneopterin aldolase [Nocardia crassostreae]